MVYLDETSFDFMSRTQHPVYSDDNVGRWVAALQETEAGATFHLTYDKTYVENYDTKMVFGFNPFDEIDSLIDFVINKLERRLSNDD